MDLPGIRSAGSCNAQQPRGGSALHGLVLVQVPEEDSSHTPGGGNSALPIYSLLPISLYCGRGRRRSDRGSPNSSWKLPLSEVSFVDTVGLVYFASDRLQH